jgi:beta-glucosidase
VLDVGRQPLWPRLWETFGEDPHLVSVMGVASVRGYEGQDPADIRQVASSLKHYVGYSAPTSGRDRTPGLIPENTLRDIYLPPFKAAVDAGALTVMVNSGEVNGVPGHINRYLLTDVLRNELHFEGLVVSDWEDIKKLVNVHHVAATEKDATRQAVMAGVDMSMVPQDYSFADLMMELVKEGSVPVSRVDEAVRRILHVKYALGLFQQQPALDGSLLKGFGSPAARNVSLQAARESITLLQNKNELLPLKPGTRILLTGPTADSMVSLNNGWSYTWDGQETNRFAKNFDTLKEALEKRAGSGNVTYVPGVDFDKEISIADAAKAAADADVLVLAIGESSYAETPGNIADLTLSEPQIKLARAMIATGKPTVVVLLEGRPRIISAFADDATAILMAFNPSNMGGQAIAEILFGDVSPSGHLPITYPRSPNALLTYDHKQYEDDDQAFGLKAFKPQFEFGSGLSYTNFAYSDLAVSPATVKPNATVSVSVKVTNTGKRSGKEVVLVYLRDVVASLTPAGKRLVRFAKIELRPGASQTLTFTLDPSDLSFTGPDNKPLIEPGDFQVRVANLLAGFRLEADRP